MTKLLTIVVALLPLLAGAQQREYPISSYQVDGTKAPNTHYIGEAWLHSVLQADEDFDLNITKATFRANSTLDWHKHATAQVLIIVEGEAYYQERGKEPVILTKGDVLKCRKDTEHWHTATKAQAVTYLAIYGGTEPTTWTAKVTQEYYDSVAKTLSSAKK